MRQTITTPTYYCDVTDEQQAELSELRADWRTTDCASDHPYIRSINLIIQKKDAYGPYLPIADMPPVMLLRWEYARPLKADRF